MAFHQTHTDQPVHSRRAALNTGTLMLVVLVMTAMPAMAGAGLTERQDWPGTPLRETTRPGPLRDFRLAPRNLASAISLARGFLKAPAAMPALHAARPSVEVSSACEAIAGEAMPVRCALREALLSLPPPRG